MASLYRTALSELGTVADGIDASSVEAACAAIASARRIGVFGCGREGLQMKGFAMRLFHLGLKVSVIGDMTAEALGEGDLFVVSAGPGELSTVTALIGVARGAGAKILFLTAQPTSPSARAADLLLAIPAQTMADDRGTAATSVLPMGSLYEGALFLLFEIMVLDIRARLGVTPEAMRANHTNME